MKPTVRETAWEKIPYKGRRESIKAQRHTQREAQDAERHKDTYFASHYSL